MLAFDAERFMGEMELGHEDLAYPLQFQDIG